MQLLKQATKAGGDGLSDPQPDRDGEETAPARTSRLALPKRAHRGEKQEIANDDGVVDGWTGPTRWKTRGTNVALAAALVAAPVSLVLTLTHSSGGSGTATSNAGTYDQRLMSRRSSASETGAQAVTTWLTATNADSSGLSRYGWDPTRLNLPDQAPKVTDASTVDARPTAPGVWLVEVGATVTPATGGAAARRYFTVPIGVAGASQIAAEPLALPAEVPAPSTAVPNLSLNYANQVSPGAPAYSATTGFLTSLLTGQGNLSLYLRPGTAIGNISPAPWSKISVVSVNTDDSGVAYAARTAPDGTQLHVAVQVDATPSTPSPTPAATPTAPAKGSKPTPPAAPRPTPGAGLVTTPLAYQLTLTARGGRWEVSAMNSNLSLNTPSTTTK